MSELHGDEITLSPSDTMLAVATGASRQLSARRAGKRDVAGFRGDGWGIHIEGAAGEIAAARYLGWHDWTPTVDTFLTVSDLPLGIEVTTRSNHAWDLIVRPKMPSDRIHVLVTGTLPHFRVRGWIASTAARRDEWWARRGERTACWWVPVAALWPMPLLRAVAAVT